MKNQTPTRLISAPHLGHDGVLEVDALWQDSDKLALLCHPNPLAGGNMLNKVVATMYRFARDHKMSVVRFNYRGVGKSSGRIQYGVGEFVDTLCVLSWALQQTQAQKLWLGGFSFGGFIACRLADVLLTTRRFDVVLDKLTLIAPSVEKNNPTTLVLDKQRTRLIYANDDEFVSPDSMANFARQFDIHKVVVPQAGHFFHGKLSQLYQLLEV